MENVITLGKLVGLLFCLPSSLLFFVENSKNTRNELAHPSLLYPDPYKKGLGNKARSSVHIGMC